MHSCLSLQDTLTTEHVQTISLSSPTSVFPFLWSIGSVFPITQLLPFLLLPPPPPPLPPPIWSLTPSLHLSEGVNEGRGQPSSLPPLLLNWLLVASVDSCRHLSLLLWRASEQTSCSFVAFLSLQPQACLPTESKRETLIINSAKVIAVTTPICWLVHTHTQFYSIHSNDWNNWRNNIFYLLAIHFSAWSNISRNWITWFSFSPQCISPQWRITHLHQSYQPKTKLLSHLSVLVWL